MSDKDQAAETLIRWHFDVEPGLVEVYRIIAENEDEADEPIKLIEINEDTVATGSFEPYRFAPTKTIPYPTLIAELTPDELAELRRSGALPPAWNLEQAVRFKREQAA